MKTKIQIEIMETKALQLTTRDFSKIDRNRRERKREAEKVKSWQQSREGGPTLFILQVKDIK